MVDRDRDDPNHNATHSAACPHCLPHAADAEASKQQ